MPATAPDIDVIDLDGVEIACAPWSWPFTRDRRQEIEAHFATLRAQRPAVWNGRVLLLNRFAVADGVLRGACFETDYASFMAWRDWDFPDPAVANIFAAAALRSADGAYLLGEMAPHTANAGQLYFPCGTPDPNDIGADGMLDLAGSLGRELREETGIGIATLDAAPGWCLVRDRGFVALIKRLTARENATALRKRILHHLAGEARPELSDIRIVRSPTDVDARMPRFVVAFLDQVWR